MDISVISVAVISHADKDHISGILTLLTSEEFRVERIYVNPDGQRTTKAWKDFRVAVSVAEKKGECKVETSVSTQTPGLIKLGSTEMHVVCPSAALALTGVGGKTPETNRTVTANTMSAALRIEKEVGKGVLLAGDIDDISLDDAAEHGAELRAK
jgi:competence protein ComEC